MKLLRWAVIAFLTIPAHAQDVKPLMMAASLPDAPTPKLTAITIAIRRPEPSRKLWLTETAILGALYAADFTLTAQRVGTPWYPSCTWPGCIHMETDPLYGRHPGNGRIIAITSIQFVADILILKHTERSRHPWVRWGGRAFFGITAAGEIKGIRTWSR